MILRAKVDCWVILADQTSIITKTRLVGFEHALQGLPSVSRYTLVGKKEYLLVIFDLRFFFKQKNDLKMQFLYFLRGSQRSDSANRAWLGRDIHKSVIKGYYLSIPIASQTRFIKLSLALHIFTATWSTTEILNLLMTRQNSLQDEPIKSGPTF